MPPGIPTDRALAIRRVPLADWRAGLPQQAALQAVYFGLSIYGIRSWTRGQVSTPRPAEDHR